MLFVTIGWVPLLFLGPLGIVIYAVVASLYGLFTIIWSIIGGVILWRDSLPCRNLDPSFYIASMVVVIVSLILVCCSLCCTSGSAKQENDAKQENN